MSLASDPKVVALVSRVKNLLVDPKVEWEKIDAEPTTIKDLYINYAVILAAIPAVCGFLGALLFGYSAFGVTFRPSFMAALFHALVSYGMSLLGVLVLGFMIDFLAPYFGSQKNQIGAFKLAVYSSTAVWVSGIFMLIPALSLLGIVGLYSLYLLYCGLPQLMKTPAEKNIPYTASIIGAAIVVGLIVSLLIGPMSMPQSRSGAMSDQISLPNGGKLDMAEMQKNLTALQATTQQAANAPPVQPIPMDSLKALLPDTLSGGFTRSEISANGGVAGMNLSSAVATYQRVPASIRLSISDMGGLGGMLGIMSMIGGTEQSTETATAYSKRGEVDGRMTSEEYDRTSNSGKYSIVVAKRVVIEATGTSVSIDDLKAAVTMVGPEKVEGLVK